MRPRVIADAEAWVQAGAPPAKQADGQQPLATALEELPELPPSVLEAILARVPSSDRLCRCAPVCHAWASAAAAATKQVTVELHSPQEAEALASGLSTLGGLRELELHGACGGSTQPQQLGRLLAHATQLTALRVSSHGVLQAAALGAGLGALAELRQLRLPPVAGSAAAWLGALPTTLTELQLGSADLSGSGGSADGGSGAAADRLGQLTALQVLELPSAWQLRPALLSGLVGLRRLDLTGTTLAGGDGGGAAGLLAALARLTQLEELRLCAVLLPERETAAPAEDYAALTASSRLTCLHLDGAWLPPGAAAHVFGRPGAALPHLRQLLVAQKPEGVSRQPPPLTQPDLASVAAGCPGLQELTLQAVVAPDAQLSPLAQLPGLTRLCLSGSAVNDGTAPQLAACAHLRSLELLRAPALGLEGTLALTRLSSLTALRLGHSCGVSEELGKLELQARPGTPPDVWRQLLERCSPDCAAAVAREAEARPDTRLDGWLAQLQAPQLAARA